MGGDTEVLPGLSHSVRSLPPNIGASLGFHGASAWGRVLARSPGKLVFILALRGMGHLSVSSPQGCGHKSGCGLPLER